MDQFNRRSTEGMTNAGLIFICTVWLQSQMSDLVILKKNPHLIGDFVANPTTIPARYHQLRIKYWERQFGEIKKEFLRSFDGQLTAADVSDIEHIYHFRNMIGHAHISSGRDYMLYRPGTSSKEQEIIKALNPQPVTDQSDPLMIKLDLWRPDVFQYLSDQIARIDQICFARLAESLGIPHGRIR
jgi:hypothetical protein